MTEMSTGENEELVSRVSDDEKSELTEWTERQEELLSALATEFEEFNGRIINVLAAFHRAHKAGP